MVGHTRNVYQRADLTSSQLVIPLIPAGNAVHVWEIDCRLLIDARNIHRPTAHPQKSPNIDEKRLGRISNQTRPSFRRRPPPNALLNNPVRRERNIEERKRLRNPAPRVHQNQALPVLPSCPAVYTGFDLKPPV